ncbi:caspase family protein [Planktothrix sp. FACHB-1355]|uniref:Caspase family protein n=1 Tax=Aerosakkonema funiforme FACHB-1375 TaxID=2949571 RepID=A0A926ZKV4_9CYAN|nr:MULTISPECIES: caspase family protein [Oscillatoriales]MBD2186114.1 caspase family protein [Aerosakkonema funiforme FACHB-1375]MBD3558243.1 caspase family protein [Planktothrix sp. FACHB-1355]
MTNFTHNLAIAIGINQYHNGIASLNTAKPDAEELAKLLRDKYQYQVELITDDTERKATLKELENLLTKWLPEQLQPPANKNRLLFYFAGHGMALESDDGPRGFLLPQDANPNPKPGESNNFLSMQVLHDALIALPCHHLIVILDCCFAGTFRWANTRKLGSVPETIRREHYQRFIDYPASQVITSAAHNQEALDFLSDKRGISKKSQAQEKKHSPFAEALFEALQDGDPDEKGRRYKNADLTKDGVITAPELYLYLRDSVETRSSDRQTPGLYPLKNHDRGEYIFHDPNFDPKTLSKADPIDETNNPYRGLKPFEEEHARFFFGRQELIKKLYGRIAAPDHSLTVVLGVSGSGKSSLVKAGLIPYLRELSEPEVFALNLVKVCILTSAILADVFPKFLLPLKFLPINYVHQWHILNPIRPGESPFAALARTIWAIADMPITVQLDSLGFLREKLNKETKELNTQAAKATNKHGETSRTTQRLKREAEKFAQITTTWNQDTHAAKQLLIVEHFETLYALCQTQGKPESQQQRQLKEVFLACLNPLTQRLQSAPNSFVEIVKAWSQKHSGVKLLLVIDQFEELVTLGRKSQPNPQSNTPEEWQQFLQLLETTLAANLPQLRLIVTLRSDFEPRFLNSEALKSHWTRARFPVRAMRSDELRQAIEGPASEMALYFEPANLVDRLIDEVGQMPGALPLLSFTLSEFYIKLAEKWRDSKSSDRALTIDAEFDKEGGVAGSLTRRANEEYKKLGEELGKAAQRTMRRVMLRMLTLEDGETARRRVADDELVYPNPKESNRVKQVVGRLVEARLLVKGQLETGEPYVEPAHDFLVRSWDQLQEWIKDEQEALALQQRLTIAVNDWYNKSQQETEQQNLRNVWRHAETFVIRKVQDWELHRERRKQKQSNSSKRSGERSIQYLWDDDPRLDQLKQIFIKNNWFNQNEDSFVRESLIERQRNTSRLIIGLSSFSTVAMMLAGFAGWQWWQTELQKKQMETIQLGQSDALSQYSEELFNKKQEFDALIASLRAVTPLRRAKAQPSMQVLAALRQAVYGQKEHSLEGHNDLVYTVAFSPDGKTLASASSDNTIKLWNLQSQTAIATLTGHSSSVNSVAFSPDGKTLASASTDNTIKLWNLQTQKPIAATLTGHSSSVNSLAFSPDGKTLASAGSDKIIKLWNLQTRQAIKTLTGHSTYVKSVAFSPDGKTLASTSGDKTIKLWNLQSQTAIPATIRGHSDVVNSLAFSPDGKTFASASADKTIKLWNLQTQKPIKTFTRHSDVVTSVAISPDGKTLASASASVGNTIKLWNLQTQTALSILTEHSSSISSVAISPDGKTLASANADKTTKLWNLQTKKAIATLTGHSSWVYSVAISPDGKTLASANSDIKLWKLQTQEPIITLTGHSSQVKSVAFSPDNKTLASTGWGIIILWNLQTKEAIANLTEHEDLVNSVAFSPDGKTLASASNDNTIKLWNLQTRQAIKTLTGHSNWVEGIAISPDGQTLASASWDMTIKLWNLQTRQAIATLRGHSREVYSVAFSPDGQTLASASGDKTIKLWNLQTKKLITTLTGHNDMVNSIAFSPDGKTLASASADNTIILWNFDFDDLYERGCNWVRPYLQNNPNVSDNDRDLCGGVPASQ